MFCKKCGAEIDDEAYVCVHCGTLVKDLPSKQNASNTRYYTRYSEQYRKKTNVMAIVGFILSFLGGILGLIFSIIGLNQCRSRKEDGEGLAIAGVVISLIWFVYWLLLILIEICI